MIDENTGKVMMGYENIKQYEVIIRRDPFFILTVVDYISRMTDNCAYREYNSLYL